MSNDSPNLKKWKYFLSDCTSPDSYIDWGFYYLVAAALQRRIWFGDDLKPLFPNLYVVLVGRPGIGKGLVISQVSSILREHKIEPHQTPEQKKAADNQDKKKEVSDVSLEDMLRSTGNEDLISKKKVEKKLEKPLVIPVAANATTYQALVGAMAKAVRYINYTTIDTKTGKPRLVAYPHCSLCFCLEEIASLFRKKTEDVVNFLLEAYDCTNIYTYETITRGEDSIRKLCLNFFGGTTPDFMESVFDDALLNQGFSSRAIFIYENDNRFHRLFITDWSAEQKQARADLVEHVRLLTRLCGRVEFAPDAQAFLKNWWEIECGEQKMRPNSSSKLDAYYARKNITAMKLAIVLHFADAKIVEDKTKDNIEWPRIVELDKCVKALCILEKIEKKMHLALTFGGQNPLYKVGQKILRYLVNHPLGMTQNQLLAEFWAYAKKPELEEILTGLIATGRLIAEEVKHPTTGNIIKILYKLPPREEDSSLSGSLVER